VKFLSNSELEISKTVEIDYTDALKKIIEALKVEGFGILTEIDVKETFKNKLNADFERYKILGACNPPFAKQALDIDRAMGTLLPCNVYVRSLGSNKTIVSAVNPETMFSVIKTNRDKLDPIVKEIKERLTRAIQSI